MKEELIHYLRTRNIESFYLAVAGGLTYDEYVTYTRRPLLEVNYISPLRFYTVCVQRDVRWLYVLDPDLLGRDKKSGDTRRRGVTYLYSSGLKDT